IAQMTMKVATLSGYLYQNIQVDENGAGRIILPQVILDKFGIDDSETASIVSLPGVIDVVLAWGIFVQQPSGYYRVRLRTKGPIINELAKRHHGGG
ncbi:bifunctional oligoribonuclease/PAP phosphatase NrnA, partial [Enterococcus faecium]